MERLYILTQIRSFFRDKTGVMCITLVLAVKNFGSRVRVAIKYQIHNVTPLFVCKKPLN